MACVGCGRNEGHPLYCPVYVMAKVLYEPPVMTPERLADIIYKHIVTRGLNYYNEEIRFQINVAICNKAMDGRRELLIRKKP